MINPYKVIEKNVADLYVWLGQVNMMVLEWKGQTAELQLPSYSSNGNDCEFLKMLNTELPYDPAITRKLKTHVHTKTTV